MTKAVKIYKNSRAFGPVLMVAISDKKVDTVDKSATIAQLFSNNELVGLNIFDKLLLNDYPDGFIYPKEAVLKQLNDYLKTYDIEVIFNYNKHDYLKVAKVVEINKVKDSDNLSLCTVLIGDKQYSMVCGAKNVRVGMKTIAALDNALLSDGSKVIADEVLGVFSEGMLCSLKELGLDPNHKFSGIVELDDDEVVGKSFFKIDWRKYNV